MMKILIIEDDKDIVAVISEELKQWGYETCSIHDFNGYYTTIFQWILLDPKDS